MYWDESTVENRGRGVCVCVCVCARRDAVYWIRTLWKGKRTPTVLICSVSVFCCHAPRSHPLLSLPLLICLYSTHPTTPPPPLFFFFTLCQASQTLSFPFHTHWFLSFFFIAFHHISGRHLPVSGFVFFFNHQKEMNHASMMLIPVCVVRHQILVCEEGVASLRSGFGLFLHVTGWIWKQCLHMCVHSRGSGCCVWAVLTSLFC